MTLSLALDILCVACGVAAAVHAGCNLWRALRPRKPAFDLAELSQHAAIDLRAETFANPAALAPTPESRALYKKIKRRERIRELLSGIMPQRK